MTTFLILWVWSPWIYLGGALWLVTWRARW